MVFFEIGSVSDVQYGHRIIIYYIKGESNFLCKNNKKLFKNTETALELLGKKNDDVLLIEVLYSSSQFRQFAQLYKPEITAPITLFAVNNEGIPLISVNISDETNIFMAIERLSTTCNLNEIPKLGQNFDDSKTNKTIIEHFNLFGDDIEKCPTSTQENLGVESSASTITSRKTQGVSLENNSTRLYIRLPNGSREEVHFQMENTLQEVWALISIRFNIKHFDLKTYNHPIFSEDDYNKSLLDLDLCPSGVLIVVNKNVIPFNNNGGIMATIQSGLLRLFTSFSFAFQYVQGLLYTFWYYIFPSVSGSARRGQGHRELKSSNDTSNHSQNKPSTKKSVSRNIGNNIHTLNRSSSTSSDSDDENNRYNGNSTQQK